MHHDGGRGPRTAELAALRVDRFLVGTIFTLAACCAINAFSTATAQTTAPAQPPQQAKPNEGSAPANGATPATVLDDKDVEGLLGKEIYSENGEDMGRVVDVLVDRTGEVRAAIIDFGGFLGVGTRKIAVDWRAIHFSPDGKSDHIVLSLTRDEVRVAPEYKQGEPIVVLGPSAAPAPASAEPGNVPAAPANAAPSK
jgi:sporulation protein YlmC with PRC-barrel domain